MAFCTPESIIKYMCVGFRVTLLLACLVCVSAPASEGTVFAWGANANGQLGNGTLQNNPAPATTGLSGMVAVASGASHSLALSVNGTVWAWGANSNGQLGDGTNADHSLPAEIAGLTSVVSISAANNQSFAVRSDGTVWAWGLNSDGQLGDGTTVDRNRPVQITALSNVSAVSAGYFHGLALIADGTVWSWGLNHFQQLGDGTADNRPDPMPVPNVSNVTQIAAGKYHSMILRADGTLWTWGFNFWGELGDGSFNDSGVPVQAIGLPVVAKMAAGRVHSMALGADGTVWTWGYNIDGELGDGTTQQRNIPGQVPDISGIRDIASGGFYCLALKNDASVLSWGFNSDGQLGDGTLERRLKPVQASNVLSRVTALSGGNDHTLALQTIPASIASALSVKASVGQPFSYTIAGGGTPPLNLSASGLPAGFSFSNNTIIGTPPDIGMLTVQLSASNAAGGETKTLTINVTAPTPPPVIPPSFPVITSQASAAGALGIPFSYSITASNNPTRYKAVGLPSGLSFNILTGAISGTPSIGGVFNIGLIAENADGAGHATLELTVSGSIDPPVITSALSAYGWTGIPFEYHLSASGASPIVFTATPLPPGITSNGSVISGVPAGAGLTKVRLTATNSAGSISKILQVTIELGRPELTDSDTHSMLSAAPVIESSTTASGQLNGDFTFAVSATNAPVVFTATELPAGLSIDNSNGLISGIPAAGGIFAVKLTAANSAGAGQGSLNITIGGGEGAPAISGPLNASGVTGLPFVHGISVAGTAPIAITAAPLPPGLSITGNVLTGVPSLAGVFNVTITGSNSNGAVYQTLAVTILPSLPQIVSASFANGKVGEPFNYVTTATGSQLTFSANGLPAGLSIDSLTGVISGAPAVGGIYNVILTADNAAGEGRAFLWLSVAGGSGMPVISGPLNVKGRTGVPFYYGITAAGALPMTFSVTDLPAGLHLSGSTITGMPAVAGRTEVTLTAVNAAGNASEKLTITIVTPGTAPVIGSFSAQPNPANVGQEVALSASATSSTGTAIQYLWDCGDGTVLAGATATHRYLASGTYTITLVAIDSNENKSNQSITIVVADDPAPVKFALTSVQVGLSFAKTGRDSIKLQGIATFPTRVELAGQSFKCYVGGVVASAQFDSTGKSKDKSVQIQVSGTGIKKGVIPANSTGLFRVTLTGKFADTLDLGGIGVLNEDRKKADAFIDCAINLGGQSFLGWGTVGTWSAVKGKSGKFTSARSQDRALKISSLSRMSAEPFTALTVNGSFLTSTPLWVRFYDDTGYDVFLPVGVRDRAKLNIAVPPYIGRQLQQYSTGTVNVEVFQGSTKGFLSTNSIGRLQISDLPTASGELGDVTLKYYDLALAKLSQAQAPIQFNSPVTAEYKMRVAEQVQSFTENRAAIASGMSVVLGTTVDGAVIFDSAALAESDRYLSALLAAQAGDKNLGNMSIAHAASLKLIAESPGPLSSAAGAQALLNSCAIAIQSSELLQPNVADEYAMTQASLKNSLSAPVATDPNSQTIDMLAGFGKASAFLAAKAAFDAESIAAVTSTTKPVSNMPAQGSAPYSAIPGVFGSSMPGFTGGSYDFGGHAGFIGATDSNPATASDADGVDSVRAAYLDAAQAFLDAAGQEIDPDRQQSDLESYQQNLEAAYNLGR